MKKNNKKKRKERRLLLLLFLLVATGAMFGTATYAWFTANKNVKVNPIDVNVEAKSGLQISADGQNWKSILNVSDLTGAATTYSAAVNQIPSIIEPVSTAGVVGEDGKLQMYLGTVSADETTGDWLLASSKSVETNTTESGAFVAYDMFLRTEETQQIYLTTNSGITFKDVDDTGIKNATRVAFVNLGNTTSSDTIPNIQGLNTGASSQVTIWEPNADSHTDYGVANARDTYNIQDLTAGTGNDPVPYDGIKSEFTIDNKILVSEANATSHSEQFQTVTPQIQTDDGFSQYQALMTLNKGITKIRVYMWIEGQDVDCENNASGGSISFDLQISTSENAGA